MKTLWFILIFCFLGVQHVDAAVTDKTLKGEDQKLSSYLSKINPKVSDNTEAEPLPRGEQSEALSEREIPLVQAKAQVSSDKGMSSLQKMMMALFIIFSVAGIAFLAVRNMNKNKGYASIGQNITVLAQKPLGPKKNLTLVRIAGETILLGVTDQNINHITTLSLMDDEIPSYTEPSFKNELQQKIHKEKEITEPALAELSDNEPVDGFLVSRLDDVKQAVAKRFNV